MVFIRISLVVLKIVSGVTVLNLVRHFEYFANFSQDALSLLRVFTPNGCNQAGIQVVFQNLRTDFVQSRLHCLDLANQVDAVRSFLGHAHDTFKVAFG
jgi:hypothetical protein